MGLWAETVLRDSGKGDEGEEKTKGRRAGSGMSPGADCEIEDILSGLFGMRRELPRGGKCGAIGWLHIRKGVLFLSP